MFRTVIVIGLAFSAMKVLNLNGLQQILILRSAGYKNPSDTFKGFKGNKTYVSVVAFMLRFFFTFVIIWATRYFSKDFYNAHFIAVPIAISLFQLVNTLYFPAIQALNKMPLELTGDDHMISSLPMSVFYAEFFGVIAASVISVIAFL
jgi:hypothetical protein